MRRLVIALACVFALLAAIAGLMTAMALREARQPPEVARYVLPARPGACGTRPVRLAVLGDLHVSGVNPPAALAETVRRTNALHPDYVLLVGDYLGRDWPRDSAAIARALAPLAGLAPRHDVVAVLGNNDWADGADAIAGALGRLGVHVLRNGAWLGPDAAFLGVEELVSNRADPALTRARLAEALALADRPPPPVRIWLAHQPLAFDLIPDTGTLLVAGHTHGGQVLPWISVPAIHWLTRQGLIAHWPARDYVRGPYQRGAARMLVTSGIGVSHLPLRLGVPPEIMQVDIAPCGPPARR